MVVLDGVVELVAVVEVVTVVEPVVPPVPDGVPGADGMAAVVVVPFGASGGCPDVSDPTGAFAAPRGMAAGGGTAS
ncbi:MAG TPA: hypothetical protein VF180_00745 [Acidimicrobiia bacterium]